MERRHLIRLAALVAALACAPAVAASTPATAWVLHGRTVPTGGQAPHVYVAAKGSDLGAWMRRLTTAHQAVVRNANFTKTLVVAAFLDGSNCAFDVRLKNWRRVGTKLIVNVTYRKPPIGVATCVRTSVSYLVIDFYRAALGRLPSVVELHTFATS